MAELVKDEAVRTYADFDNRERVQRVTENSRSAKTLPVIDFSPYLTDAPLSERRKVARALHDACTYTGFFYLANHGISAAELDVAHDWGRVFFELPREVKASCGYSPVGGKTPTLHDEEADQKETFSPPRPLLPGEIEHPSRTITRASWPDAAVMPGFKEFLEPHIVKRIRIAQRLCRALALSLDLPEEYFDEAHRYPTGSVTYNYYPPLDPAKVGRTQWGISPHTDYGSFSLLSQDELGGLEVRDPSGEWIDMPPKRGMFVVNIADLMARWTNGVYVSSLHRASNFNTRGAAGDRARISLPLFFNPYYDTKIECLPTCQGADRVAKYEPVLAGPYVRSLIEQSQRIGRPGVMRETAAERMKPREGH
jgi:isopenicillin N synthase-like dioxygenase